MAENVDMHQMLNVFKEIYDEKITQKDLQELKSAFVMSIYMKFVQNTLCASMDNMRMLGVNSHEAVLQHPEAFERAVFLPRTARLLHWFFSSTYNCNDFNLHDLIQPNPGRTRKFFSMMVKFIYTYCEMNEKFEEIKEEIENRKTEQIEIINEKERVSNSITTTRNKLAEKEIQLEQEEKESRILSEEMSAIQQENKKLKGELENFRLSMDQLKQTYGVLNEEQKDLESKLQQLKSEVVEEQEINEASESQNKLEEKRREMSMKRSQLASLESTFAEVQQKISDFTGRIICSLTEINNIDENAICVTNEMKDLGQRREIAHAEHLDHQIGMMSNDLKRLEEEMIKRKDLFSKMRLGLQSEVETKEEMLNSLQTSTRSQKQQKKALVDAIEQHKKEILDFRSQFETFQKNFRNASTKLHSVMEIRNQESEECLQSLLAELKKM